MEKILNQYEKEYMKMAMLKHEETFREQVYELHRLYQIQKILMKNIAKQKRQEIPNQREFKNAATTSNHNNLNKDYCNKQIIVDLERPADEDESELELTLGPSCYNNNNNSNNNRRRKAPEPSDSAPSFSSSTENSREDLKWGIELPATLNRSFLGGQKSSSNVVEDQSQFRQDRLNNNNPPWLFQALSLNMT